MCSLVSFCIAPLKYRPCGYNVMRMEGASSVYVCDAKRPRHMGVLNLQLLLILPHGSLLAKGVNRMLMCATSELCVCFYLVSVPFFCIVCVTSAGNESHPPIADEDKETDRLYKLAEAKMLEDIQTLWALFPKWATMIDRSETTQCLVSNMELQGN